MKTAILTGASSGLGIQFARQLKRVFPEVEELWLIARRQDRLEALAAELTAEEAHFLLQPFHAFQHMMNGVDAFDIDREIVIQVAISFQFPELGGEKIPFAVDGAYFDQPSFFERNNKSRVGMALLAIFVENN